MYHVSGFPPQEFKLFYVSENKLNKIEIRLILFPICKSEISGIRRV